MMSAKSVVMGVGHCVPNKVLTNQDLEKLVDTNDEWITQRTGIKERRVCEPDEAASDLAIAAAEEALSASGIDAADLDMVIVSTVCGDYTFPSTACLVQDAIGAKKAGAFDLGAACAGFIYGMAVADGLLLSGQSNKVLLVGVDVLSKFVDWTDRSTCILFGDGAAAVVMERTFGTDRGIIQTMMRSDGSGARHICMDAGGSRHPIKDGKIPDGVKAQILMNGNETYRFAVNALGEACCSVLEQADLKPDDVDLFVPHQANKRIIDAAAERMGLSEDRVFTNIHKYGNTSAASVPLGLYEAEKEGRLKQGDVVLTVGFGAGLVWGANVIRW